MQNADALQVACATARVRGLRSYTSVFAVLSLTTNLREGVFGRTLSKVGRRSSLIHSGSLRDCVRLASLRVSYAMEMVKMRFLVRLR